MFKIAHSKRLMTKVPKQVIASPSIVASFGEDASQQRMNEAKGSWEAIDLGASAGLESVADMGNVGDMGDVIASGEAMELDDMDSGDNTTNFIVVDKEGYAVVMEEASQERIVEKLKVLEPEQLVEAAIQPVANR